MYTTQLAGKAVQAALGACSCLQHNRLQGMTGLFKEASKMQEVDCGPFGVCLTSVDVYTCDIEQLEIHMTAQAG